MIIHSNKKEIIKAFNLLNKRCFRYSTKKNTLNKKKFREIKFITWSVKSAKMRYLQFDARKLAKRINSIDRCLIALNDSGWMAFECVDSLYGILDVLLLKPDLPISKFEELKNLIEKHRP